MDKQLRSDLIKFFEQDGGQGWYKSKMIKEDKKKNFEKGETIDLTKEEAEELGEEEQYPDYPGFDVCSLSTEKGFRSYNQQVH